MEQTKKCRYCQKEIAVGAKRCPHCHGDLRVWPIRHPIWTLAIIIFGLWALGAITNSTPTGYTGSTTNPTSSPSVLSENKPTIQQLATFPADYVGQSFVFYVNVETSDYYNYGFSDETRYYSVRIWDNSVDYDINGVYAYLDKTAANKILVNNLLNHPEILEIHASIPASTYESGSNSFLKINSWKVVQ